MRADIHSNDALVAQRTRELISSGYSVMQGHRLAADDYAHISELRRLLAAPGGARVIDLGCGIGEVARWMRFQQPDLEFTLLNVSKPQLALCPPSFRQVRGDFNQPLPFVAGEFGAALCCYALGYADDLGSFFRECARVLSAGAPFLIYDLVSEDSATLTEALHYAAWSRETVEIAARGAGFALDCSFAPVADPAPFLTLLGRPEFDRIFYGVTPHIFRLVKS